MAFIHLYTILCDDVRKEDNGKLMILGLYANEILIPQLPYVFSTLSFFQGFKAEEIGQHWFEAKLSHTETGKILAQAMGSVQVSKPGPAFSVLRFSGIKFENLGAYYFRYGEVGQDQAIDYHFDVKLKELEPKGV